MLPPLLASRRFLPLFVTQFLGAFNDNLIRNALLILATYRIAGSGDTTQLAAIAGGLFMLPFFLFSATAGQLADKYDRAKLTRIIKVAEIVIMGFATIGFLLHSTGFLLLVLFCMGTHSTFFGPIKYALLPQHLKENELLTGNAYIEAGTFLSILLGTIVGGVLVPIEHGEAYVSGALLVFAAAGYAASRFIPPAPGSSPELTVSLNIFRETWRIVGYAHKNPRTWRCIMGISWFWLVGVTFLNQFAPYAKNILNADSYVVTLFITVFALGIGVGSFLCSKLLRGSIHTTYVPLASLGLTIFGTDLYFASSHAAAAADMMGVTEFLYSLNHWRILADLFFIAANGGLFIVPLFALMQKLSEGPQLARIIAANNIMNSLFMVGSAIATILLFNAGFTIPGIFLTVSLANGFVAIYICALLPDAFLRSVMRVLLRRLYHVEVKGIEHFYEAGDRVLIVANHISFLDAALIAAYLPEKITFAVNTYVARKWWMKPMLLMIDAYPLDPTNPLATKALIDAIRNNRKCMIFPEGRITVTGALMKIYEGPGLIADKAGALILPVRIDGAQYTPLSRLKGKARQRWFPRITLTILPPCRFEIPEEMKGHKRRQMASAKLYDVMSEMMFESSPWRQTLFASLIDAQDVNGRHHVIVEDIERQSLTYAKFISRSFALGHWLERHCAGQKTVGLLLPTATATALTFFALQAYGRTPAMLNFTAGAAQITVACTTARIATVITSRRFVEAVRLTAEVETLAGAGIQVLYLEDISKALRLSDKLFALFAGLMPRLASRFTNKATPDSPAVILFTSGSEGTPKGVVLSHANIQANRFQLASRIDFGPQDRVFNCLPMFHAFGLMGGTLMPLLTGIRAFYYPSPLHYRIVPELIYDTNATILFGTDTFLTGYAQQAHPYDLHSVRYVFAGAEKLREETRKTYAEKFGVRIFEGYGATETSPAISTGTPMQNRAGTVGRFMPGIEYRLEHVAGIEEGGKLWVKGPNVMLGYLRAENPGVLQPLADGWYDTGDIVEVDELGYITIKGRVKRFAKIAGEMVSLAAVEGAVGSLWPGQMHAAVSVPDERKGEQIVLLTDYAQATREALVKHFRSQHVSELAVPRQIIMLKTLPLLGTGKIDYQKAKQLVLEERKQPARQEDN